MKIQSVRASLEHVDKAKIPNEQQIEECLESVDESFREALGYKRPAGEAAKKEPASSGK